MKGEEQESQRFMLACAMKHYCQTKLCRWCDSPPSPPNGGHPKYYVAIMNEQFQMSLSHSYGCSWNLQQGKFAEFNSEFLIQFMTLHSTPIPRLERESKFIFLSFQMKYGMSLGRWIVCRDDNSSHHPTTTIEMPIILQKNFWRSMPMGDGTVTYLVVPELYRNTLNHPQTKSTTTDYEMWKSSAGQLLLFVFIPQF